MVREILRLLPARVWSDESGPETGRCRSDGGGNWLLQDENIYLKNFP